MSWTVKADYKIDMEEALAGIETRVNQLRNMMQEQGQLTYAAEPLLRDIRDVADDMKVSLPRRREAI